jgi:hypothetical protein
VSARSLKFDHVGIPTTDVQPGETFFEETRSWVTDPREHPQRLEFLRFEDDSPVTGPLRDQVHLGYRVPKGTLDELMEAADEVLIGPWESVEGVLRVGFVVKDGACLEYMEYLAEPES